MRHSIRSYVGWMTRLCVVEILLLLTSISYAAELNVPGSTSYLEPDEEGAFVVPNVGVTRWRGSKASIVWFGKFDRTGLISVSVRLRLPSDHESKLQLSIGNQSHSAKVTGLGKEQDAIADFGEFEISSAGYCRITLSPGNGENSENGEIRSLHLNGDPVENAHFNLDSRRNAASVHLVYPTPKDARIEWFYTEVTAVDDPVSTFYMACGFHRGYFGMQVNGPKERRIIFSVWDAGSGSTADNRREVATENHVSIENKGADVHTSVFGGEGTGGHSHLKYFWKTGEVQRFLVTAKPVNQSFTIYSGYYFHPEKKLWILISSMKAPKDGGYLRGLHSFSENFVGNTGQFRRKALFGNQWIRTIDGGWKELSVATFSHDQTGSKSRLDRFMGVEQNQFFLSHGGFAPGYTKFGERFERPSMPVHPSIMLP